MMIKHHILVAMRNIYRNKGTALVNFIGLTIGVTFSLLVFLIVKQELSYDQSFTNYENTYRLTSNGNIGSNAINTATSPIPLKHLLTDYIEVTQATHFIQGANNVVTAGDKKFNEDNFIFADPSFFKLFNSPVLYGDVDSALTQRNTLVISKSTALKYFNTTDVVGKTVQRADLDYRIGAVCKDFPSTTHFEFTFLASISTIDEILMAKGDSAYVDKWKNDWLFLNAYTYLQLKETTDIKAFEEQLNNAANAQITTQVSTQLIDELVADSIRLDFNLQPLKAIHLTSHLSAELDSNSKPSHIILFIFVALVILISTCINFVNLTTAKATKRYKEIGVRQLVGASRRHLIQQFLIEAGVYSFGATLGGLVLLELLLPFFNVFFGIDLHYSSLHAKSELGRVLLLGLTVTLMSGAFPALFFAFIKPGKILQRKMKLRKAGMISRGLLVATQMAVAVFLFVVVAGMWWQAKYITSSSPGFNTKNIMIIERGYAVNKDYQSFKARASQVKGVNNIAACTSLPGDEHFQSTFTLQSNGSEQVIMLSVNHVDENYFEILDLSLRGGRFLNKALGDTLSIMLNQAAVDKYNIKKPVGEKLNILGNKPWDLTVGGVVKDFFFESYYKTIEPLGLTLLNEKMRFEYVLIQLDNADKNTIAAISAIWEDMTNNDPFVYTFLEDRLNNLYKDDVRTTKIISVFAILSLIMSLLGTIGLTTFILEFKDKDNAVKKALGASDQHILMPLFLTIGKYMIAGALVALLIGHAALQLWLSSYQHVSNINQVYPILITLGIVLLAFTTVAIQTLRFRTVNPLLSKQ